MQPANKISISPGNQKMGYIPSISLPPVVTCANGCTCANKCYAARLCKIRKTVRNAYQRNLDILTSDPGSFWLQVKAAAMVTKYFRFHVAGDIPNPEYLQQMTQLARDLPGAKFLAFTKQYSMVNDFLISEDLPENLQVIFSAWPGMKMHNPHNLPVANVIFKGMTPADNWKICGGNCADCACRGVGCWELKPGEQIAFYEH